MLGKKVHFWINFAKNLKTLTHLRKQIYVANSGPRVSDLCPFGLLFLFCFLIYAWQLFGERKRGVIKYTIAEFPK